MANLSEREQRIVDFIKNDKVMKKYINPNHWVSGSSTLVYPITVWANDIDVQMTHNARANYFKGFFKRLKNEFGLGGYFCRLDGSCPNVVHILK